MFGRGCKRRKTGGRAEHLDHPFAVSVTGRGQGTSLASGPFIRRKRCKAGFQGLQAHEKKYSSKAPSVGFTPPRFSLAAVFFFFSSHFVWFGSVWFGYGPV